MVAYSFLTKKSSWLHLIRVCWFIVFKQKYLFSHVKGYGQGFFFDWFHHKHTRFGPFWPIYWSINFQKILSARLFPHAVLLFFREKFTMLVYLRVLLYSKPKSKLRDFVFLILLIQCAKYIQRGPLHYIRILWSDPFFPKRSIYVFCRCSLSLIWEREREEICLKQKMWGLSGITYVYFPIYYHGWYVVAEEIERATLLVPLFGRKCPTSPHHIC